MMHAYPETYLNDAMNNLGNMFDYGLWKGMKTAIDESGFLGLFTGGFTACAAGVSAALIFGYLASLIFNSKMRK